MADAGIVGVTWMVRVARAESIGGSPKARLNSDIDLGFSTMVIVVLTGTDSCTGAGSCPLAYGMGDAGGSVSIGTGGHGGHSWIVTVSQLETFL